MYKIIDSVGREIGKTEAPYYIKTAANGCLAPCAAGEAQGVSWKGRVYSLFGRPGFGADHETVLLVRTDAGGELDSAAMTAAIAFVVLAESGQVDGATAGERAALFLEWAPGTAYTPGQLRRRGARLYRCLQAHTAQEGWEPENAAALWAPAHDPAEEWPAWSQPICSADAYAQGDRVSHGGKRWLCTADGNVWEPGVHGWTEYAEEG